MSVIWSMQAGQPVATTRQPRGGDVIPLASADGRRGLVVLEIEAAAAAAAPVGLGHLGETIGGVGLEQGPGLGRHPQRFFQMAGIVIGQGNPAGRRANGGGRHPQPGPPGTG